MFNLIPPQGKKALKWEYILRIGSVYAIMFSGVFLATTALMVPTYVYVSSQLKATEGRMEAGEKANAEYLSAEKEVKDANAIIAQLTGKTEQARVSALVEEVVRVAPQGVRFKTFSMESKNGAFTELTVQGSASSRATLLALKQSLESSSVFETATIPIGDLARDADLPFTVTVTLAPNAKNP